jgi:hypothetical protein
MVDKNERFFLDKQENYPYILMAIAQIYCNIWQCLDVGIEQARFHLEKCGLLIQGE